MCLSCPSETALKTEDDFYVSYNPLHSDGLIPWCKQCVRTLVTNEEGVIDLDELKALLRQIDRPYYKDLLQQAVNQFIKKYPKLPEEAAKYSGDEIIGFYFKNLNMAQNKDKHYIDSVNTNFMRTSNYPIPAFKEKGKFFVGTGKDVELDVDSCIERNYANLASSKPDIVVEDMDEDIDIEKIEIQNKRNKEYVLSTFGYDPFLNMNLTENDRAYCFNTMSGFCDMEDIREDVTKRLACIQIVNNAVQCKKLDEAINKEMLQPVKNEKKIKDYAETKKGLQSTISVLCKDNNISSGHSGKQRAGKNSLTQKMQDMFADGIENVKVNLFNIETCECMKQIADCSNRSIMEQLSFDSNDYTGMIKEQRELIQKLQSELDEVKEKYRLCNNELIQIKAQGGR